METEILDRDLRKQVSKVMPQLEELAGLAIQAMSLSGNTEEAVVFCIVPGRELDFFISQIQSSAPNSLLAGAKIVETSSDGPGYIFGLGDHGFAICVSMLIDVDRRDSYQAPPTAGKVKGFFFFQGVILRLEITPKQHPLN